MVCGEMKTYVCIYSKKVVLILGKKREEGLWKKQ